MTVAKTKNVIPEVQLRAKTQVSSEEEKKPNERPPRDLPFWFIISDRQVVQKTSTCKPAPPKSTGR
ncbi:hypothetical protein EYF80_042365 [Liparis tanakae]|uniref:Uncharacterized protein n=1 Tax=Liparis tanakae TaxID=230148 RepID=A0A4Z2G4D6_9TELE|nr:hypothetical protein EYF80_042365 [Liparis tanakae]